MRSLFSNDLMIFKLWHLHVRGYFGCTATRCVSIRSHTRGKMAHDRPTERERTVSSVRQKRNMKNASLASFFLLTFAFIQFKIFHACITYSENTFLCIPFRSVDARTRRREHDHYSLFVVRLFYSRYSLSVRSECARATRFAHTYERLPIWSRHVSRLIPSPLQLCTSHENDCEMRQIVPKICIFSLRRKKKGTIPRFL